MTGGPRNTGDPSVPTAARGGDSIPVGISSCLLGEKVRFDGGHKLDQYAAGTLGQYVDWVPVCPELEMGLGVPRDALRLVGDPEAPRLVTARSRVDHTEAMLTWARDRVEQLRGLALDGYLLKSKSPSYRPAACRAAGGIRFGSRLVDSRAIRVAVPPPVAFEPIARLGGTTGWYAADALWRLRGFLDLLVGGVGLRRGRRDPRHLVIGDAVDFWRVEAVEPGRRLRLAAEMRLPGRAWLVLEIEPDGPGSVIRQTALFDPVGLPGLAYWYLLYPFHRLVFSGMLRGIARQARRGTGSRCEF